jgi:hypothetical protein
MRIQFRAAFVAAVSVLVTVPAIAVAQDPAPPPVDFSGTYTLTQVDDANLPVQFDDANNCSREVTGATLTIQADNTWMVEAQVRETCGETVNEETTTEEGNFAITADGIDFDPDDETIEADPDDDVDIDELATGTLEENMLRVQLEDAPLVLVFQRQ